MNIFDQFWLFFQVTLPTPEPSSPNETSELSEPESKSTVIDTDETTKNSEEDDEEEEADKTIDDNTEDDSAVWIEVEHIMKEKRRNYWFKILFFFNSFKKLFLALRILALCCAGKIPNIDLMVEKLHSK